MNRNPSTRKSLSPRQISIALESQSFHLCLSRLVPPTTFQLRVRSVSPETPPAFRRAYIFDQSVLGPLRKLKFRLRRIEHRKQRHRISQHLLYRLILWIYQLTRKHSQLTQPFDSHCRRRYERDICSLKLLLRICGHRINDTEVRALVRSRKLRTPALQNFQISDHRMNARL